jgi:hypothetical protein
MPMKTLKSSTWSHLEHAISKGEKECTLIRGQTRDDAALETQWGGARMCVADSEWAGQRGGGAADALDQSNGRGDRYPSIGISYFLTSPFLS